MKRGYATLKSGRQVHYAEAGEGAPLLLLHSAPRSSRSYRMLLPQLAPKFRAIAPDLPGFGQSDPLDGQVTMETLAGAMADFLGALGIAKAHVFGYHTGNKVAAALAANHAKLVERLILCGQIHSIIPDTQARNDAIRHIVAKYFAKFPSSPSGDEHLRRWLADWGDVTGFALPREVFSGTLKPESIEALKVRVLDHVQALSAIEATYGANFTFDFSGALKRIAAKTLVLELVMPDEEHYGRQLQAVCKLLKDSHGATIMNAGKVVLESHTEEVARQIRSFLQ
jgi:pimeloyl-ACP methyl ester carboxylesterase